MATIRELLLQIPEHGEKAIINAELQEKYDVLNRESDTISESLISAFIWLNSVEGYDFWCDIHIELKKNE